jgi:hypothetical protein
VEIQCNNDGALFCKAPKREIENYCCPDKIKLCYINSIKEKEGKNSQNARIGEIEELEIEITDDMDVEAYLKKLGLHGFKSGYNIKVLESMTKEEWKEIDTNSEIEKFIKSIYSKI